MSGLAKKKNNFHVLAIICCVSALALTGCASSGAIKSGDNKANAIDPFEDFNRSMFSFNKTLDDYLANPIVDAYTYVTPSFVQTGIGNFFNNLKDINVVLNDVMQAKFSQAGQDTGRFLLNTTAGLGGLIDVATGAGLEKHDEDFDQTFATWGIPQGPYLVLPLIGPTTTRGIPGKVLDTAANPTSYIGMPVQLVGLLNERANADSALKMIDEAALDPYVFTRSAYLQFRNNLISDGKLELADEDSDDVTGSEKNSSKSVSFNSQGFNKAIANFSNVEKSLNNTTLRLKTASDKIQQLHQ